MAKWILRALKLLQHTRTRWAVLLSGRPRNCHSDSYFISCNLLWDLPFRTEPGWIGQLLRGGGLDARHPRSIRLLLPGLDVSRSGTMSACFFGAFSSVSAEGSTVVTVICI